MKILTLEGEMKQLVQISIESQDLMLVWPFKGHTLFHRGMKYSTLFHTLFHRAYFISYSTVLPTIACYLLFCVFILKTQTVVIEDLDTRNSGLKP